MIKIIIKIHSFIDVITNSSTELFVCDTDRSLEAVKGLVYEIERQYPNEYGHGLNVDYTSDYELDEAFEYNINEEDAIKLLKAKGYKITKPKKKADKFISISAERGGLHPTVKDFIEKTFNVVYYTTES